VEDGYLQLTSADFKRGGTALFALDGDLSDLRDFEASFELWFGATGGDAVSFCVGHLVEAFIDQHGVTEGLCVSFVAHSATAHATYNGTAVAAEASLAGRIAADTWLPVEIGVLPTGLRVHFGGELLLDAPLPNWSPTSEWAFGISARTGVDRATCHFIDRLRITAGALLLDRPAVVEVSLDGQQATSDGVAFTYLGDPHVRALVHPASGPVAGVTLVGLEALVPANLLGSDAVWCVFGAASVNATFDNATGLVSCTSPAYAAPAEVLLTVVTLKQGHVLDRGRGANYRFYPQLALSRLEPASGPVNGSTQLIVYGNGLAYGPGPFGCRFDSLVQPATVELHSGVLRCEAPPRAEPLVANVSVSLNGQQFETGPVEGGANAFRAYMPPRIVAISPASGTVVGGVAVTVYGSFFERSVRNLCRWGNTTTTDVATLSESELVCTSPPASVGAVPLEVTQNGQQYSADRVDYFAYQHPAVRHLTVPGQVGELGSWLEDKVVYPEGGGFGLGVYEGGFTLVRAWGSGFMGGTDYRCMLNAADVIPATYDSELDCIKCWSNLWLDGANSVEVTLNGRQYTGNNYSLQINPYW
jgi:hypothetical protein